MLELQGDTARVDDETADRPEAAATGEEASTVICPSCGSYVPDEKVSTGLCTTCWDVLPSELDSCYGPGARHAITR